MAELTQAEIETKITDIDSKIATIVDALGTGTDAAQFVDYKIGSKSVSGSQQLEGLREIRKVYQDLLDGFPNEITRDHPYEVSAEGDDETDLAGDE